MGRNLLWDFILTGNSNVTNYISDPFCQVIARFSPNPPRRRRPLPPFFFVVAHESLQTWYIFNWPQSRPWLRITALLDVIIFLRSFTLELTRKKKNTSSCERNLCRWFTVELWGTFPSPYRLSVIRRFLDYIRNLTNNLLWKLWSVYSVLHIIFPHILPPLPSPCLSKADIFPCLFGFLFYAFIILKLSSSSLRFYCLSSFSFCVPALGDACRYQVSISRGGRLQAAVGVRGTG